MILKKIKKHLASYFVESLIMLGYNIDFEGRCHKCNRQLRIGVSRIGNKSLILELEKCEYHPEDCDILWPVRDDLVDVDALEKLKNYYRDIGQL